MRDVEINDLLVEGAELPDDRLARVAGGLLKPQPGGPPPTNDMYSGTLDPPGSAGQTNGWHTGSDS